MLVLTRKSNQSIMIGDEIEVSVLAIMGEKVRIGIEAPRSIPVFRKEVYLEIRHDSSPDEARQEGDAALEKLKTPEEEPAAAGSEPREPRSLAYANQSASIWNIPTVTSTVVPM